MKETNILSAPQKAALRSSGALISQDKLDEAKALLDQCTQWLHESAKVRRSHQRAKASKATATAAPMKASSANKADLEHAGHALAKALQLLRPTHAGPLIDALPALLHSGGAASKHTEESGTTLGFSGSQVQSFIKELASAGENIGGVVRAVREKDLPLVVQFFTNHPDPIHWGFGYSEKSELPPAVASFTTACRRAGVLPSIYVLYCLANVLHRAHSEAHA